MPQMVYNGGNNRFIQTLGTRKTHFPEMTALWDNDGFPNPTFGTKRDFRAIDLLRWMSALLNLIKNISTDCMYQIEKVFYDFAAFIVYF